MNGEPKVYYWGRLWDAPFTDNAEHMTDEQFHELLHDARCYLCGEGFAPADDVVQQPYITAHLECNLRMALGEVAHLEGRCLCTRGRGNEIVVAGDVYPSWRDSARASLQWLLEHGRGRFR